jgi:hypothetical protein
MYGPLAGDVLKSKAMHAREAQTGTLSEIIADLTRHRDLMAAVNHYCAERIIRGL